MTKKKTHTNNGNLKKKKQKSSKSDVIMVKMEYSKCLPFE